MKKMVGLLVFLFVLYFGLQILFVFVGKGHEINYKLKSEDNEILINEKYNSNGKDKDNYILTINVDNIEFKYLTYNDFKKSSEIIKDVKYFKDDFYKCIFVKFKKDKILTDVLCYDGNVVIPYHSIKNPSVILQQYITELGNFGYAFKDYIDDKEIVEAHVSMVLYSNNRVSNHHVSIAENKMLYNLNTDGSVTHKTIFTPTQNVVHGFVDNKYVAYILNNNKSQYEIYSLNSTSKKTIEVKQILGNQVVLGSYGQSLYIYDSSNKIEYEVDIDSENVLQIGSAGSKIKYYESGEWKYTDINNYNISSSDFGTEYVNDYNDERYVKIIKRGFDIGYYYAFENFNNRFQVYRSISSDMENATYLFTTDNINSVKFVEDYIYYMDSNIIKYYSDITGNRTLLYFDGLNKNSIYNVFEIEKK